MHQYSRYVPVSHVRARVGHLTYIIPGNWYAVPRKSVPPVHPYHGRSLATRQTDGLTGCIVLRRIVPSVYHSNTRSCISFIVLWFRSMIPGEISSRRAHRFKGARKSIKALLSRENIIYPVSTNMPDVKRSYRPTWLRCQAQYTTFFMKAGESAAVGICKLFERLSTLHARCSSHCWLHCLYEV